MDMRIVIDLMLGTGMAILGWFAREMWAAVKELNVDLSILRAELPKQYITKDDYKNDLRELKEMLGKIFDKLDSKADKR